MRFKIPLIFFAILTICGCFNQQHSGQTFDNDSNQVYKNLTEFNSSGLIKRSFSVYLDTLIYNSDMRTDYIYDSLGRIFTYIKIITNIRRYMNMETNLLQPIIRKG